MHVTVGAIMLTIILIRCLRGHFTEHHFAFEAVSWYWHLLMSFGSSYSFCIMALVFPPLSHVFAVGGSSEEFMPWLVCSTAR